MAETLTNNLKLSKRDTGDLNWGTGANGNMDVLDQHGQLKLLRPPRTLLASLGSGAVGANLAGNASYFYKVTATNAAGETTEGQLPAVVEAQITEPASPVPIILQWEAVAGATGYKVYKATATGQEQFLAAVSSGSTLTYTDTGNTATTPATSVPATNTARASVTKIIAGTNVTVTPADGTGDVTVSASGGSSGVTGLRQQGASSPLVGDVKLDSGTGITLTQDGVNNKIIIAASGGSGGGTGYATVVIAAPSGNATTDTGNINTAISSIATNGGTAQLREGTYFINANISIPAKVTLRGMGRGATILKGQTALDTANAAIITLAGANCGIKDLDVDMSSLTGSQSRADILISTSDFEIADCFFDTFKSEGLYIPGSIARGLIHGCTFRNWADVTMRADGSVTDIRIANCGYLTTLSGDLFIISNTCARWVVTNCTGDGVRMVFNSAMPPKSSMTNCAWNLGGFQSGLTMGTDCVLSNCTIVNPSNNANIAVVVCGTDTNCVITGNRLISGSVGKGLWMFGSNHVLSGNRITASIGIQLEGGGNAVSGNRIETGAIVLQPGVSGNNVVGNKSTVTDNSGQSNVIANNG
jgi:hypothetical protein